MYTKLTLCIEGYGRHAQVEAVVDGADAHSLGIFFTHGSVHVLTNDCATLLSQEEYSPFWSSSDSVDVRNSLPDWPEATAVVVATDRVEGDVLTSPCSRRLGPPRRYAPLRSARS